MSNLYSLILNISVFSFQASLSAAEEKLARSQSEAHQLKTSIKKHESLMDKYKSKVQTQANSHQSDTSTGLRLELIQTRTSVEKVFVSGLSFRRPARNPRSTA